jgi:dihydrofolate reductase
MRKLVYPIASTIDGFIADPGGHDPSGPDGFSRADQDCLEHLISEYPETMLGQLRQYVVSRTLAEPPDPAAEVIRGDPVAAVRERKRGDGKDIWLCGGGKLAGALRPEIDELVVELHPVAVGSGVRCSTERSSHSGSS